jgi:hypothetical protein
VTVTPSEWATGRFGADAESVAVAVVGGLHEAHARAFGAHVGGGLATADAYGGVLWLAAPEEILNRLTAIDGAGRIKPDRARYTLGVVNNQVVYPVRIATDLRTPPTQAKLPMSRVKEDLFSLGPVPTPQVGHPTLFDDWTVDTSQDTPLQDIDDFGEAGLVVVAYVSSPDGGLLRAWWGEAALLEDGHLDWQHIEQLDLSQTEPVIRRPDLRLVRTEDPAGELAERRFSDAPLEETPLGLRNPLITPVSEPQEAEPPTGSSDDD